MDKPSSEKKPAHKCVFCDKECSLEYYLNEATVEEVEIVLVHIKVCTKHARQVDDANMKRQGISFLKEALSAEPI